MTRFRGLLLQLLMPEVQGRDPFAEAGVGTLALDLQLLESALVAGERLAQRVQQLRDRLLSLTQIALGGRPCLLELRVGQGEELLVVPGQCLGRQLCEGSGEPDALLLGPRRRLRRSLPHQLQLVHGDGTPLFCLRGRLDHDRQLGRLLRHGRPRVRQAALGEACRARQAGTARQVPCDADRQPDSETEDHSDDHEANVTMGCVNFGDRSPPARHAGRGEAPAPRPTGRHAGAEPVA